MTQQFILIGFMMSDSVNHDSVVYLGDDWFHDVHDSLNVDSAVYLDDSGVIMFMIL